MAESDLRRLLVERLRAVAPFVAGPAGMRPLGACLFTYAALQRERLASVRLEHPLIGIVLSGRKEVWIGEACCHLGPGDVFVFPAAVDAEVVNSPDERHGLYESLLVEVRDRPPLAARRGRPPSPGLDLRIPVTTVLVDALSHAAAALSGIDRAAALARHRLAEVLMLLEPYPQARALFSTSLADEVCRAIAAAPPERRGASAVAQALGMSVATLRRRLSEEGHSFRGLALEARMRLAHALLARGQGSVAEAAEAAGYRSRSHFARSFRRVHGHVPKRTAQAVAQRP